MQPFHKAVTKAGTAGTPIVGTSPGRLSHQFIRSIDRPGRFGDGRGSHGLSIRANRNAAGGLNFVWQQRISIDGQKCTIGLGTFPIITLQVARNRAFDNARMIALGEDIRKPTRTIPTVAQAFDQVIANRAPSWKGKYTLKSWRISQEHCKSIHAKKISDVTSDDVLNILKPIWHDRAATAVRVKSNLSTVMDWAIIQAFRTDNPAHSRVTQSLGTQPPPEHHKSAPYEELGTHLIKVRDSEAWWAEKYCLIFMAFTADRSGEAREATWEEIDFDEAIFTIPAHRMKASKEHVVPLSKQAIEILRFAERHGHHSKGTIFPPKRGGTYLNGGRLSNLTHNLDLPFVPHGLRSSFRDWAGERDDINQDAADVSIAHTVGKKSKRAYLRTQFFKQRRKLMQEWADLLLDTMKTIVPAHQDKP